MSHIVTLPNIVGQPYLAQKAVHKSAREVHVVVEGFARVGLTKDQAKAQGIKIKIGLFPGNRL